ncbi:MAG: hypothetical protein QM831_36020 [Kofleriaceae bacterium]
MRWLALGLLFAAAPVSGEGFHDVTGFTHVDLKAVFETPDGTVLIGGEDGTLIEIRGSKVSRIVIPKLPTFADTFEQIEKGSTKDFPGTQLMKDALDGVVVSGKDVWVAVGESHLAHFDGIAWSVVEQGKDRGGEELALAADGRLWITGATAAGTFSGHQNPWIWDPQKKTFVDGPDLPGEHMRGIAAQGDDIWVDGYNGSLYRSRKGGPFTRMSTADDKEDYNGLWLDPKGTSGYVLRRSDVLEKTGDTFAPIALPPGTHGVLETVFGIGGEAWVAGDELFHRTSGGAFEEVDIADTQEAGKGVLSLGASRIEAVHGRAANDVWMVGRGGGIYHYDGKVVRSREPRFAEDRVIGLAWLDDTTWTAWTADNVILEGNTTGVTKHVAGPPLERIDTPDAFTALASGELAVATCSTVFARATSGAWKAIRTLKVAGCIHGLVGTDREHLWVVTDEFDAGGHLWRLVNGAPSEVKLGLAKDQHAFSIATAPDGSVWVGAEGAVFHVVNGAAKRFAVRKRDDVKGISIRGPNDVWFAIDAHDIGAGGAVAHWNGTKLERIGKLAANALDTVVALPDGNVWAFGLGGVATHSTDGKTFTPFDLGGAPGILASAARNGTIAIGGEYGAVMIR